MTEHDVAIIESTASCFRLPALVFAAEEIGISYTLRTRPDGYFDAEFRTMGPAINIDGEYTVGLDDALLRLAAHAARSMAECETLRRWIAFHVDQLRPAFVGVRREQSGARETLERCVDDLDACFLASGAYLEREFGLADCLSISFVHLGRLGMDLGRRPALGAYIERLMTRDAWVRASRRIQEAT